MKTEQQIRDEHNENVRNAAQMLRDARNTPEDQDIDRNEALQLVSGGVDTQVLLDEIQAWRARRAFDKDEIEHLTAENEKLRGALEYIASETHPGMAGMTYPHEKAKEALATLESACKHHDAFIPADSGPLKWGDMTFCPDCLCVLNPDNSVFMQFPEESS